MNEENKTIVVKEKSILKGLITKKKTIIVAAVLIIIVAILLFANFVFPSFTRNDIDHINTIKTDTITLLQKANENYAGQAPEVEKLTAEINQFINTIQKQEGVDEIVAAMNLMMDSTPNHALLGRALAEWKEKGTLSAIEIDIFTANITIAFNQIIAMVEHYTGENK
jgi:hypothetical protein